MCAAAGGPDEPWTRLEGSEGCATSEEHCRYLSVKDDCMGALMTQMISYTVVKPMYEIPLQLIIPILTRKFRNFKLEKALKKMEEDVMNAGENIAKGMQDAADAMENAAAAVGIGGGRKRATSIVSEDRKLARFHEVIESEEAMASFAGTFGEYNTKVIQYGYVAMFSSAFPLCALTSAVANFIELKSDAAKVSWQVRRPRYMGAEDIGSWAGVMNVVSWIAIITNVFIIAFASSALQNEILIPILGDDGACNMCDGVPCGVNTTTEAYLVPDWAKFDFSANYNATLSPWAADGTTPPDWLQKYDADTWPPPADSSIFSNCKPNWVNCAGLQLGGVSWLPAFLHLTVNASVSVSYVDNGLCSDTSSMYNPLHCEVCRVRNLKVEFGKLLFVIIMEHVLVFIKLFLAFAINDVPDWIVTAMARADFQKTKKRDNARSENQRYSIAGMQWATETPTQREEDKRRSILEVDEEDDPRNTPVELPVRAISFAKKKSQAGEGVVAPVVVPAGGDGGARSHASSAASNPSRRVSWAGTEGGLQLIPEASLSPGQSHDPAKPQLVGWSRYASHDAEAIAARAGLSVGTPRGDSPGGSSGGEAAAALAAEVAAPQKKGSIIAEKI